MNNKNNFTVAGGLAAGSLADGRALPAHRDIVWNGMRLCTPALD